MMLFDGRARVVACDRQTRGDGDSPQTPEARCVIWRLVGRDNLGVSPGVGPHAIFGPVVMRFFAH